MSRQIATRVIQALSSALQLDFVKPDLDLPGLPLVSSCESSPRVDGPGSPGPTWTATLRAAPRASTISQAFVC